MAPTVAEAGMLREMWDRPRVAAAGTAALLWVATALVVWITDLPLARRPGAAAPEARARRAALAWRDEEIPLFQWGTHVFTEPSLGHAYAEVVYLTQRRGDWGAAGALYAAAEDLLGRYEEVDVFLAVHGGRGLPGLFAGLEAPLRRRLRLVYSTGCGDTRFAEDWLALGADAFVGHPGALSLSPVFYVYFLRRWIEGRPLAEAVAAANGQTAARLRWAGRLGGVVGEALVAQTLAEFSGEGRLRLHQ